MMSTDTIEKASPVIVLIGPTAVGKTALSLSIAEQFGCEIISVDSMQIYRYMDIGTAKASTEERQMVPHHLIDIVDPDEEYDVSCFIRDALRACEEITARSRIPLLTGGTGLYLKALLEGLSDMEKIDPGVRQALRETLEREGHRKLYERLMECDPLTARRIHPNDTHRLLRALEIYQSTGVAWSEHTLKNPATPVEPAFANVCKIGLACEREVLYRRINERVRQMVEEGLLDEVRHLLKLGYGPELKSMQSIGYRHMLNFLDGSWAWEESVSLLARDTRRYAKRQFTWFGRDRKIQWFESGQEKEISGAVRSFLRTAGVAEPEV
jgi:tRNA dimethylallyltransferase